MDRLRCRRQPRRTRDERQFAQFRPLGDHRSVAARAVHPVPESGTAHHLPGHFLLPAAERGRSGPRARRSDPGTGNPRHLHRRPQLPDLCAERPQPDPAALRQGRVDHRPPAAERRALVRVAPGLVAAVHRADRRVDIPVAADAGSGRQGARFRKEPRQAADRSPWPRHVRGRGRRRRSQAGSAGDRRVPARSRKIPAAWRAHPARRAAGRPARHRQDPACARHRRRGQCAVLHHFGLRLRRDVRRRRRLARARHVRAGQEERALHHLHRRDRCRRSPPRRRARRRQRRARADAQSACWSRWTGSRRTRASS